MDWPWFNDAWLKVTQGSPRSKHWQDPFTGHPSVYLRRRGDLIKIICGMARRVCLFSKRLEKPVCLAIGQRARSRCRLLQLGAMLLRGSIGGRQ
jgi:hypothetical protein